MRDALRSGDAPEVLYEILLQTYLFAGFPPALEGLRALHDAVKELQIAWTPPREADYDATQFRERGEELYRRIYATNHARLRDAVRAFSPDMFQYMIIEGYGKVLSRPGPTGAQRELATVTALAALGWERQTISHARGAINLGATISDVLDAISLAAECAGDERAQLMSSAVVPHIQ